MNKIYKIVWNAAQEAWVAVSELAKGHVKASSSGKNAKQSTVVEEEGSASSTLYSLGKAAANAMVIGGVAVTLFSLSQTAQAADKHETPVVAQQGTREKAQGQEPNALLALGNDTKAGGRSTVVIGESSRINGTVAMALGNGINIDHGIADASVFLGKSIDDRYNQNKTKVQSQYVKSQVIGSDIYFTGLTNNKVDGLKQATLMGNNIKYLSEEQSNSMMTASNFVFRGIKAQDSAVNGHGITVNLNSSAKRAVLNRSSITGTKININSTGDINEMLVSGTTISVTRQNNALGGALVGNNINFDSTGATVNTEKVNYVGQDINVTASSTSNPLFGQGIALHNSNLSGAPTFGQNIKSSNSTISNTLTQGYNTTFNGATVNDSVLTVNNATITGRLTNATLMGRDINTSGNVADTQVVGNRNTVTASNTQVLGSGITANVNNSVYLGDGSEVEAKGVGEKVAINIKTEGRTAGTSDYGEQLIHDGTRAKFAGGSGVSGAVTVGNATNTRRIQHVAPGYYDANSTDAVNGSQLYAVGQSAGNAYFKAVEAAKAAKAADDKAVAADAKAVAAQARADAAHSLATTANTTANNALNKANTAQARADAAHGLATTANTAANNALNKANAATTAASNAQKRADAAHGLATTANTSAAAAKNAADAAQTRADDAYDVAGTAMQEARTANNAAGVAKNRADEAYTLADRANGNANTALTKANAADAKATSAQADATKAKADAGQAKTDAAAAKSDAAAAKSDAKDAKDQVTALSGDVAQAKTDAAQAKTDAGQAKTDAAQAKTDAGQAKTDAADALAKANAADTKADAAQADATQAKADAGTALTKATDADTKAGQALAKATDADTKAGAAQADATQAKADAAQAKADAGQAKTDAAAAKTDAKDAKDQVTALSGDVAQAKTDAADALAKAGDAETKADAAKSDAAAAKTDAKDAKDKVTALSGDVTQAKTDAADALAKAGDAETKADAAKSDAAAAKSDAANALTTANGIDAKATQAVTDAASAKADVSKALNAVNEGWTLQTGSVKETINAANRVVTFNAGKNIEISQTGSNITVALTNDINVTKVTAGTVVAGNLTAKNATLGGADHTVKVENGTDVDMGGNQIHNVGDGVKDSDAATVGQLNRALDQVAGSPAKINELNNRVDKMNKEMRGYAANAMAAAALPQVYTAGDSMISAAVGSQGGATSVAVGYSRALDNGKAVIKLNMAASSSGEKGVAAGIGYKW